MISRTRPLHAVLSHRCRTLIVATAIGLAGLLLTGRAFAASLPAVPAEPLVRPQPAQIGSIDTNADRVDDAIAEDRAALARELAAEPDERRRRRLRRRQAAPIDVELVFDEQITAQQLEVFMALGGQIDHVFRTVSYGWTGRIPAEAVVDLPSEMGASLRIVQKSRRAELHLDEATRTGRVRPVWSSGFAGNPDGFSGSSDTTVAIVDTGIDDSHPDFNGRIEYWRDFTTNSGVTAYDVIEHGSHVAGIAAGSGASFGEGPGTLAYTDSGFLLGIPPGYAYLAPIHLPTSSVKVTARADWIGGGATTLYFGSRHNGVDEDFVTLAKSGTAGSPLQASVDLVGDAALQYTTAFVQNDSGDIIHYTIAVNIEDHPGVGDGFAALRGVAPGARLAAAKVFNNAGEGLNSVIATALDELVSLRQEHGIKVMNLSFGTGGSPGLDPSLRAKVNTAVANGIVVTCSAGNDGPGLEASNHVDDPCRASLALTVGASSDANQVTDYTSIGFLPVAEDEDVKPDLLAPGGSLLHSYIHSVDSNDSDGLPVEDAVADDYRSLEGTSMAAPFAAGAAALLIEAMESTGEEWDFDSSSDALFIKMMLCASATETNAKRESDVANPHLGRIVAPKDRAEGYGVLNVDAAVEAVASTYDGATLTGSSDGGPYDRRAWGRRVDLAPGQPVKFFLDVPPAADYDMYLVSGVPDEKGNPVILRSSTKAGAGTDEAIVLATTSAQARYLFIKRVSGSGEWSLTSAVAPVVCGDGVVAAGEDCDDGNVVDGDCCTSSCQADDDGTPCTDGLFCTQTDSCQGAVCVGTGDPCAGGAECAAACDEYDNECADPGGTPCASDFEPCTTDVCDGSGHCVHPPGNVGHTCRPAGGVCDVAETCDGNLAACPPDVLKPGGVACRSAIDACDAVEVCTGIGAQCPLDLVAPAGTICRPTSGACDVADVCNGLSDECPALDAVLPAGTACLDDGNECTDDLCNGSSRLCQYVDNSAPCDDGFMCNGPDTCQGGFCGDILVPACTDTTTTTLAGPLCGDANEDGQITANDALVALRGAVGSYDCPLVVCDYSGDEAVTASDALSILRRAVGLPVVPNCTAAAEPFVHLIPDAESSLRGSETSPLLPSTERRQHGRDARDPSRDVRLRRRRSRDRATGVHRALHLETRRLRRNAQSQASLRRHHHHR